MEIGTIIIWIVIWILFFLSLVFTIIANRISKKNIKNKSKMSFKESMDLVELPIITFISDNNIKLNFLLDTGSNVSFINESILQKLNYTLVDGVSDMIGVEGNKIENKICEIKISYKEYVFDTRFNINDMDNAFGVVKQESGVQLHGILGSLFFQKYKYALDFESLTVYMK